MVRENKYNWLGFPSSWFFILECNAKVYCAKLGPDDANSHLTKLYQIKPASGSMQVALSSS